MTASPGTTSLADTSRSSPFRVTRAVCGCMPMSVRMASDALPFALASSSLPKRTSAMMAVEVSKYVSPLPMVLPERVTTAL